LQKNKNNKQLFTTLKKTHTMKKRFSVLLMAFVAVTMLFSSCKKDQSELILGTWNLDGSKSYQSIRYGELDNTEYLDNATMTLQFKSDGTVVSNITNLDGSVDTETFSYTIADGVLTTIDEDNDVIKMTIDKLTDAELIFTHTESYDVQGMTYTMVIHYEFTR